MLLFLLSCTDAEPVDSGPTCATAITATDPADGGVGHHYREPLVFSLTEPDLTAVVLADFPGRTVFADDGATVVYELDEPLEPNQDYTVTLDYCRGEAPVSFTTSDYGSPMDDPSSLEGAGFSFNPADGRYIEGEGVGEVMASFFGRDIMVEVIAYDGDTMDIRAAVSETTSGKQEECRRTNDIVGLDTSALPYFRFEVEELSFDAYETGLNLLDFHIDGTFSSDGQSIEGVGFGFSARISELAPILNQDEDALCDLAEQLGVDCTVCGGVTCITVSADRLVGEALSTPLTEVGDEDIPEDCEE
jgi:hypothetical protein